MFVFNAGILMCYMSEMWRLFTGGQTCLPAVYFFGLFFDDLAQTFSGILPERFQFGV
jgi:hypothetical protein